MYSTALLTDSHSKTMFINRIMYLGQIMPESQSMCMGQNMSMCNGNMRRFMDSFTPRLNI